MLVEAAGGHACGRCDPMVMGRPRVGQESGLSPQVRARVSQALKHRLEAAAKQQQRSESEVVREALTAYVMAKASWLSWPCTTAPERPSRGCGVLVGNVAP